jgi:N-acyl-L-homoserine lactone synthetase
MNIAVAGRGSRSLQVFPELEPVASSKWFRKKPPAVRRPAAAPSGHVKSTMMSFSNVGQYGELLPNFLKARKRTFIDRLHWDLPQTEGMEFDQYDTPQCRWVAVHEYGEILGGFRLLPTTASCGIYSYMLRDAQLGLLDSIPQDVLFIEAPVEKRIVEASRLFIAEDVPASRRIQVQSVIMAQMVTCTVQMGATHTIGIVPAVWSRWLRRMDLNAVPVGRRFSIDGVASQAAIFNASKFMN